MDGGGEPDLTPDRINEAFARPFRTRICCEFWVWGILYALIVTIAEIKRQSVDDCGIPVILWNEVFFGILLLKLILVSSTYFCLSSCSAKSVGIWYIVSSAIGLLLAFAWVIYGYVIYFSDENECQESPDNFVWLVLMVIIIFLFIFALIILLIMLCFVSCLLCCLGKERTDQAKAKVDGLTK